MATIAIMIIVLPIALFIGLGVGFKQQRQNKAIASDNIPVPDRITHQLNGYQRQISDYTELLEMLEKQYNAATTDSKRSTLYRQMITTRNRIDTVNDKRQRLLDLYDITE